MLYFKVKLNPDHYTVEKYEITKMKKFYSNFHCDQAQGLEVP